MQHFLWRVWSGHWDALARLLFVVAPLATLAPALLKGAGLSDDMLDGARVGGAAMVLALVLWAVLQNWRRGRRRRLQVTAAYSEQLRTFKLALDACVDPEMAPFVAKVRSHVTTIYCGVRTPAARDRTEKLPISLARLAERVWPDPKVLPGELEKLEERVRELHQAWNEQTKRPRIQVNSPHAIAFEADLPAAFDPAFSTIEYVKADYVALRALIEAILANTPADDATANWPMVLGAGGLLVYPRTQQVLFLKRSEEIDTHVRQMHVFGGNFEPDVRLPGRGYDQDLKANAEREILEECGALVSIDEAVLLVHKERADESSGDDTDVNGWKLAMRYAPLHFLGLVIDEAQYKRITASPEGNIESVQFRDLSTLLREPKRWVPAGWLTVMTWLWLGAPCQHGEPIFSSKEARKIARKVLGVEAPKS